MGENDLSSFFVASKSEFVLTKYCKSICKDVVLTESCNLPVADLRGHPGVNPPLFLQKQGCAPVIFAVVSLRGLRGFVTGIIYFVFSTSEASAGFCCCFSSFLVSWGQHKQSKCWLLFLYIYIYIYIFFFICVMRPARARPVLFFSAWAKQVLFFFWFCFDLSVLWGQHERSESFFFSARAKRVLGFLFFFLSS